MAWPPYKTSMNLILLTNMSPLVKCTQLLYADIHYILHTLAIYNGHSDNSDADPLATE